MLPPNLLSPSRFITRSYVVSAETNLGFLDEGLSWVEPHCHNSSSAILAVLSRPKSRGFIKLRSGNPEEHPIIQPNYLTEQEDVDTLVAAMKFAVNLSETEAFTKVGAEIWVQIHFKSDEYWECYVKHMSCTIYHPVGTCAMDTVVDQMLRVKGVARLRVVDGSVMPNIVGGNTNAPIIMIAEKGADMILQDWGEINKTEHAQTTGKEEL